MNIRVVIGAREGRVSLAPEFFGYVPEPSIAVGINPADSLWDGARHTAQRIGHGRYQLSVHLSTPPGFTDTLAQHDEVLRVREDPASRSGVRSQALYLFEGEFRQGGVKRAILGQFLPRGCTTSCHHHEHTTERFVPVLGEVCCWRRGGWEHLARPLLIEQYETHCLHARTDSFVVIIMDGPYGLIHADHHYDDAPILRQY